MKIRVFLRSVPPGPRAFYNSDIVTNNQPAGGAGLKARAKTIETSGFAWGSFASRNRASRVGSLADTGRLNCFML
jgi:hypothetical protein